MKRCVAALALAAAAAGASVTPETEGQRCSSLNGPFCSSLGAEFAFQTPPYAAQDIDRDEKVNTQLQ